MDTGLDTYYYIVNTETKELIDTSKYYSHKLYLLYQRHKDSRVKIYNITHPRCPDWVKAFSSRYTEEGKQELLTMRKESFIRKYKRLCDQCRLEIDLDFDISMDNIKEQTKE